MSTSGQGLANAVLYVALVAVAGALARRLAGASFRPEVRPAAVALWLAVAVPSLLQLAVPGLLDALRRDPELIGRGQVWRILTSAVVQDGGLAGTAFNLVLLAVVAMIAVPVWGGARMWVVVVVGQLAFDLWTTFVFPSPGAGNSGLTFSLAASLAGAALVRRGASGEIVSAGTGLAGVDRGASVDPVGAGDGVDRTGRGAGVDSAGRGAGVALAAAVVVIGVALVALLDAHGLAVLTGIVVGAVVGSVSPSSGLRGRTRAASTE